MVLRVCSFLLLAFLFDQWVLLGEDSAGLSGSHRAWLEEEVPYIIADQERSEFLNLSTDTERDAFIDEFWRMRDPDPTTEENEYRSEHYQRIRSLFHPGMPS